VINMPERMKYIDVALIYALWNGYGAAVNEGDLDCWISLWVDDGIQMPPNKPSRFGKEQIREAMQLDLDRFITSDMVINTEEVHIFGDRAYAYGAYAFVRMLKGGGEKLSYSGKFLAILEKQVDSFWKIAVECLIYSESHE
jgi:uncharacterized protein (TIGR02246 family)